MEKLLPYRLQRPWNNTKDLNALIVMTALADIACGGVGTERATIVVIRTEKGEKIWKQFKLQVG